MSDLSIVFQQEPGEAGRLVRDRLDMYNVGVTGISAYYPVHFFVKSPRGETLGGLLGGMWGGWLHITYLWIDEAVHELSDFRRRQASHTGRRERRFEHRARKPLESLLKIGFKFTILRGGSCVRAAGLQHAKSF